MGIESIRVHISKEGMIIIGVDSSACSLTEGEVNMLIEKLNAAKVDSKEYRDISKKISMIDKKYNGFCQKNS